jgi:hypothetical protein
MRILRKTVCRSPLGQALVELREKERKIAEEKGHKKEMIHD